MKNDTDHYRVTINGDALFIFNRKNHLSSISDSNGICNIFPISKSFNNYNGLISVTYNLPAIVGSPQCFQLIGEDLFSNSIGEIDPLDPYSNLIINYDVRSLVSALSVNIGINDLNDLILVPNTTVSVEGGDITYTFNDYYDPKYIGMKSIFCTRISNNNKNNTNLITVCLLRIGTVFGFPIFNHLGKNFGTNIPEPCDCSSLTEDEKNDPNNNCNVFRFIHGVFYYMNPLEGLQLIQYYVDQFGSISNGAAMVILFIYLFILIC